LKKYLLFILFFIIIINVLKAQDTIVLINNRIIPCKVIKIGVLLIEFKVGKINDTAITVNYIELNKVIGIIYPERKMDIFDNDKMSNYFTELYTHPENITILKNPKKLPSNTMNEYEVIHYRKNKIPDSLYLDAIPSLRLYTELTHWLLGEANFGFEYRINKHLAINTFACKYPFAIITPTFSLDDTTYMEEWRLQGYNFTGGIKYYPDKKNFYINCQYIYKNLSFPKQKIGLGSGDHQAYNFVVESMSLLDNGLRILLGKENKSKKPFFSDLYVGLGIKYEIINRTIYGKVDYGHIINVPSPETIITKNIVPTIYAGIKIGIKSIRLKHTN
jgi:hypothetical protein